MKEKTPTPLLEEMYQMRTAGISYEEIAKKFNKSASMAAYLINNYMMERVATMNNAKDEIREFRAVQIDKLLTLPDIQVGQVFVYGGEMFLTDEPHSKVEWSDIANKYVPNLISK